MVAQARRDVQREVQQQQQDQGQGAGKLVRTLMNAFLMAFLFNALLTNIFPDAMEKLKASAEAALKPPGKDGALATTAAADAAPKAVQRRLTPNRPLHCLWPTDAFARVDVYVDRRDVDEFFDRAATTDAERQASLVASVATRFSDRAASLNTTLSLNMEECIASNCTLRVHTVMRADDGAAGATLKSKDCATAARHAVNALPEVITTSPLMRFRRPRAKLARLMMTDDLVPSAGADAEESESTAVANVADGGDEYRTHMLRSINVNTVVLPMPYEQVPPYLQKKMTTFVAYHDAARHPAHAAGMPDGYLPLVEHNRFWALDEHYLQLNASSADVAAVAVALTVAPLSLYYAAMQGAMEQSIEQQEAWGLSGDGGFDEIKRIFTETSWWLLGITFVVNILHTVFEFMAFRNDVTFWKTQKNLRGLSLRGVAFNCVVQLIIFLYLMDNEKTSWAVSLTVGAGVLVEFWKLTKCMRLVADPERKNFLRLPYTLEFNQEPDDDTQEHDRYATKVLYTLLVPCFLIYAAYNAHTNEHKGWWSFIIRSLASFVYWVGFIHMCPQIFINYKLKSVTHMPWKSFMYKALTTVIDDLFAFVVTMPTMHRIACFRDDVVFVILLYQRYIYSVDKSRVNEYGQCGLTPEEYTAVEAQKAAEKAKAEQQQIAGDADAAAADDAEAGVDEEEEAADAGPVPEKKKKGTAAKLPASATDLD
jgi:hypothetical protein